MSNYEQTDKNLELKLFAFDEMIKTQKVLDRRALNLQKFHLRMKYLVTQCD